MVRTVIVGQGYVGLPLAMLAVEVGHDVIGYEVDPTRVQRLSDRQSYVEDVSNHALVSAWETGRYLPTVEEEHCKDFEIAVISVPTPLRAGLPDVSCIEESAVKLGRNLTPGATVVLESTTYPGTTTELLVPALERASGLKAGGDFSVGYSPERVDPGNPLWSLRNTPKVVSGIDQASLASVRAFYAELVDTTVDVSTTAVAELVKLLENTFRHVNIALVNELAMFAGDMDVDLWEAISAASTKPFGFMPFSPGPGVGGHCLPVDPSYLSWKIKQTVGMPFRFVELANDVNDHMPDYVTRRITSILNRDRQAVNGSRILVLGMTYKRNSGDAREAPGPTLCDRLADLGADVRATDSYLDHARFPASARAVILSRAELEAAHLVVVVTDHDDMDWDLIANASVRVFDTRHRLPPLPHIEYL